MSDPPSISLPTTFKYPNCKRKINPIRLIIIFALTLGFLPPFLEMGAEFKNEYLLLLRFFLLQVYRRLGNNKAVFRIRISFNPLPDGPIVPPLTDGPRSYWT